MKKIIILIILLILTSVPVFADVIHLKNGRTVEGEMIEKTDTNVEVRLKSLTVKFDVKDIQSVEKKEIPNNFFVKEDSTRSDNLKVEGYSAPPENPSYKLVTKATYRKIENKEMVEVEGDINLPEKSTIYVALKKDNNIIDSVQIAVSGNKFIAYLGPFAIPLSAGDYKVETSYLQPEKAKSAKAGQAGKEFLKTVCNVAVNK